MKLLSFSFFRYSFFVGSLFLLLLGILGCASQPEGRPTFSGNDLGYRDGETDRLLPKRLKGFNPETDVDYQTLQAQTIYFGFDYSTIASSQRGKLHAIADWARDHPQQKLLLAGHTDDRGTLEYNRGLGERRAQAVRDYLIGLGLNPSHLHTISYGKERSATKGSTENDHAKNRRVAVGLVRQPGGR